MSKQFPLTPLVPAEPWTIKAANLPGGRVGPEDGYQPLTDYGLLGLLITDKDNGPGMMATPGEPYVEAVARMLISAPKMYRLLLEMVDVGAVNNCADEGVWCNGCGVDISYHPHPQKPHDTDCVVAEARELLASFQPPKEATLG